MTKEQKSTLIFSLFKSNSFEDNEQLDSLIHQFGVSSNDVTSAKEELLEEVNTGVGQLNHNQFDNLLKMSLQQSLSDSDISSKLNFYEIDKSYHKNIMAFLEGYKMAHKSIKVDKLDVVFKGVQVATFDDFSQILNQKFTGDWVIDPKNVKPFRIQIASMKETGSYTRGYYINADIEKMEPVDYEGKTRYRIFITNPIIVNSGNRNIKFNNNPVRYIK